MKKTITTLLLATILQLLFTDSISAQLFAKDGPHKKLKIDFFREENFPIVIGNNETEINSKVMKSFRKSYSAVSMVEWFEVDNLYVARFKDKGKSIKVYYTPKGEEFAVVSTYDEKQMPSEIRKLVKSTYYDFTITQIIEIGVEGKIAYLVQMTDEYTLLTIRILDMEMNVYSEFNKSR